MSGILARLDELITGRDVQGISVELRKSADDPCLFVRLPAAHISAALPLTIADLDELLWLFDCGAMH